MVTDGAEYGGNYGNGVSRSVVNSISSVEMKCHRVKGRVAHLFQPGAIARCHICARFFW